MNSVLAAELIEHSRNSYELKYSPEYQGHPISLSLPKKSESYFFNQFPACFEGLLPEGVNLEALLRTKKINRDDHFSQLIAVGRDLVGSISVQEIK